MALAALVVSCFERLLVILGGSKVCDKIARD
jgi:hypothetical protein